jgi:hypothetical protein
MVTEGYAGIPMRLTIRQSYVFPIPKKGVGNEGVLLNPSNVCARCVLGAFQSHQHQAFSICYPVSGKISEGNILVLGKIHCLLRI